MSAPSPLDWSPMTRASLDPGWFDLTSFEAQVFSENGEDGVLERLLQLVGETNRFCVELGVGDGKVCNTRRLVEQCGWQGVWIDARPQPDPRIRSAWVQADNVNCLLRESSVPQQFDVLSIDLDGNDYWVWESLHYSPRIVVVEYNASVPPHECRAVPYDPEFRWDHRTDYFGAGLLAFERLGRRKGYALVHCEAKGVNAFFVAYSLVNPAGLPPVEALYRPPRYGDSRHGHDRDTSRPWIDPEGTSRWSERVTGHSF